MNGPTPGAVTGTTSYRAGSGNMDWQERAACRQHDPELWYVTGRDIASQADQAEAKRICHGCPVILECRRHALDNREPYGIWGGLDEDDREEVHASARKRSQRPPNSSDAWRTGQEKMSAARRANAIQARTELITEIEHLAARSAGRSPDALKRALQRAGRHDLIARLTRAA